MLNRTHAFVFKLLTIIQINGVGKEKLNQSYYRICLFRVPNNAPFPIKENKMFYILKPDLRNKKKNHELNIFFN